MVNENEGPILTVDELLSETTSPSSTIQAKASTNSKGTRKGQQVMQSDSINEKTTTLSSNTKAKPSTNSKQIQPVRRSTRSSKKSQPIIDETLKDNDNSQGASIATNRSRKKKEAVTPSSLEINPQGTSTTKRGRKKKEAVTLQSTSTIH
jgi:hypothetical protein